MLDNVPHNVNGTLECARLVLELDFDKFEGNDDERFSCARAATGRDTKGLVHLGPARQREIGLAPEIICCTVGDMNSRNEN
jgi:hypothetical protein